MPSILLSYARGDDADPFDPATTFVVRLHRDLTGRGFEVWFDRIAMPSRGLTFYQEIQDAVAARERLVLVVGPKALTITHNSLANYRRKSVVGDAIG